MSLRPIKLIAGQEYACLDVISINKDFVTIFISVHAAAIYIYNQVF